MTLMVPFDSGTRRDAYVRLEELDRLQRRWLSSDFRLQIDGVDCSGVSRVEPIHIQVHVAENLAAGSAFLEIDNVVLTVAASHSQDFRYWHDDFVIQGNNAENKEKSGALDLLTPNLNDSFFTLLFNHLGILRCRQEKSPDVGKIASIRVEMYCEEITLKYRPL